MKVRHITVLLLLGLLTACGAGGVLGSRIPSNAGGGGGPIRPPVPPVAPSPAAAGIIALCAGDGVVRIDYTLPGTGFEAALFSSTVRANVFNGTPELEGLTGDHVTLTGRANGTFLFFGFGIRATGTTEWTPIGTACDARPAAPYYVNHTADPNIADGRTPATAFPSLVDALLVAFINNGGNVWVAEGDYTNGPFPVGADVHVFGGFTPTFDVEARDPRAGNTRMTASTTHLMVDMSSGSQTGILDGLIIDGGNLVPEGISVTDSNCQLRSVAARRFVNRGVNFRLSNTTTSFQSRRLVMIASSATENGLDGLLVTNVVTDATLDRCVFSQNFAQGVDFNDLLSMDNNISRLVATGCAFHDNLSTGMSADLSLALGSTHAGGGFEVRIDGCSFLRNGDDGMFLDQQYDGFPEWLTQMRIRDCVARGNRLNGIRINADQPGNILINRLRSTANQADGVLINSKTDASGEATVSASWLAGNFGAGLRTGESVPGTPGLRRVFASHCAFLGNQQGGFVSTQGEGSATSCIALRQSSPWSNVRTRACFEASTVNDDPFFLAPELIAVATDNSNGALTLQSPVAFAAGGTVEVGDDDLPLAITSVGSQSLVVTPAPAFFSAPEMVFGFAGTSVHEDLRLIPAAAARGTAMAPIGTTLDPGPHGSAAGGAPGVWDPLAPSFARVLGTSPSIADGVTATTPIVITFDRALAASSVTADRIRCVTANGTVLAATLSVSGATITVSPTGAGWTTPFVVEVHTGLLGSDGTPFGTPLVLPIRIR